MPTYVMTKCNGKVFYVEQDKRVIMGVLRNPGIKEGKDMEWIADQVELSRSIAERYWRVLESPDIFWDDDLMRPMAWIETEPGKKPVMFTEGAKIWPLWTTDDAMSWMTTAGHALVSVYSYGDSGKYDKKPHVEAFFTYGPGRKLVKIDEKTLLIACLRFIDNALKGEYDKPDEKIGRAK